MISENVMKRAVWFHGVAHLPINICCHCGECDDPEGYWGEDKDGDRICLKCERAENEILNDIDTVLTQLDPFAIAWASAPEMFKRYTEMMDAEYWYRVGLRDAFEASTREWNGNLKAMMAARELK